MKIVAGIDGGGTGTTLEIWDDNGNKIARKTFGAFNLNSIGESSYKKLLSNIFETIVQAGDCRAVCIGAAGISNPQVKELTEETGERYSLSRKLILKGDQDIALYGAMSGKAGAILISGTGSICNGMGNDGTIVRAGGWGHLIDDEGSGYALGRDTLSAIVKAHDGRGAKTILTRLVQEYWQVTDINGLIAKTYSTSDKSNIASLSCLLDRGAKVNDMISMEIIRTNAQKLCKLVQAVSCRLMQNPLPLCLMGGLLTHDTVFCREVVNCLSSQYPEVVLKKPDMDAASGAALWAWRRFISCCSK